MTKDFSEFFLMTPDDAKRYSVEVLGFFASGEELNAYEIGDGNINYVFRVISQVSGKSVIIKQADRFLRSSGRPLDLSRNRIEAGILKIENELAPGYVPVIYKYDEIMAATSMEDISAYKNMRKVLAEHVLYRHFSDNISTFMAKTLLPTTDLVLGRAEKKKRVQFFTNPELCDITEDLVLTEPYYDYKGRNIITDGNEDFVREFLYEDKQLHAEVGKLRNSFMNHAQALIHGDLHSGSIFINEDGIKVLDPEFAFYGPMGYDIGNVLGNLFFSLSNHVYTTPDKTEFIETLGQIIAEVYDLTREKLYRKFDELVKFPLYRTEEFKRSYIDGVMSDSVGYAGTEIIRRVVGDSKVSEMTSVSAPAVKIPMERALIRFGISLIKERDAIVSGSELTRTFQISKE
ncbi:MAG: S-methyl-5-thioribose kinase [Eubacteriales bacterium]|nr:S-methyl-5-thioribose kinase [Eubacteriales bacterium]